MSDLPCLETPRVILRALDPKAELDGPWWPGREVGWAIRRDHWRQSYAVEAAATAMDHAFDRLGWDQVIHIIQPENGGSVRVAEKLGARLLNQTDSLPGFGVTAAIWGQSAADWRARPR